MGRRQADKQDKASAPVPETPGAGQAKQAPPRKVAPAVAIPRTVRAQPGGLRTGRTERRGA